MFISTLALDPAITIFGNHGARLSQLSTVGGMRAVTVGAQTYRAGHESLDDPEFGPFFHCSRHSSCRLW